MNTVLKNITGAALLSAGLLSTANAALIGVLPATSGGSDFQAYYDDQLDITWTANANINGKANWDDQIAWAAGLDINGVTNWRLPNMDVNGDGNTILFCSDQAACKDDELSHLFTYGAGTVSGDGITPSSPGPFSNIQASVNSLYWSSTTSNIDPDYAMFLSFSPHNVDADLKSRSNFAWAVKSGNVGAVPVPAAAWLFGSGLLAMLGLARRKASTL